MIVYDCEIVNGILGKKEKAIDGIRYCKGWTDFRGMEISVIAAYDYYEETYRVFCRDNLHSFQQLIDSRPAVIGYNNKSFDDQLCSEWSVKIDDNKSYDILVEIWKGLGLGPKFKYPSHAGYGLGAVIKTNMPGNSGKMMGGWMAPVEWQRGNIGRVIDYCLSDVALTRELLELIISNGGVKSPVNGKFIPVAPPPFMA